MRSLALAAAIAATAAVAAAGNAAAATFRWASDVDSSSMDPYAREETFLLSFDSNIYEPLARRDKDLKLEPALALSWTQTSPTVWRFVLRRNVRFQDGTPFTADDVLFSFDRVR
ncbi:MAG: ABC transporter substrate-binding protein, partial [Acidobacteriota bacterium]